VTGVECKRFKEARHLSLEVRLQVRIHAKAGMSCSP